MIFTDFADVPRSTFGCVLADPPWSFKNWSDKGKNRQPDALVRQKGLAERHYKTMPMHEIRALPVGDVCTRDAALFLWAVDCMLPEAIEVGTAWGFRFKTVAFTWAKTTKAGNECRVDGVDDDKAWHKSLGYWTRGNPESCLLFTRGQPRRLSAAVRQLIVAPRREHSRKPEEARERIEALLPGPYLEMFCRQPRDGWTAFGNQVGAPLPKRPVILPCEPASAAA
jgi:N6-adenosine-specific RNA methylase IME4